MEIRKKNDYLEKDKFKVIKMIKTMELSEEQELFKDGI